MSKTPATLKKVLPKSPKKTPLVLLIEILLGALLSFLSLPIFAYITENVLTQEGKTLDTAISQAVYAYRSPVMTNIMHAVSFLGNEFIMIMSVIVIFLLTLKKHKREATFFFLVIFLGFLLNLLLKYLLKVPRPTIDPLLIERFYSFPSGHSMNSFIFYGALAYLAYHLTRDKNITFLAIVFSAIIIFLIGFSRIYLGVHYPSDVIAGFIAGFWWLVTVILIDKTLYFYKISKTSKK